MSDIQSQKIETIAESTERVDSRSDDISGKMSDSAELLDEQEEVIEHLTSYIDNLPGMAYRVKNEEGWPVMFASDGTERLTGYRPDRLVSGEVSLGEDIIHEEDQDDVWNAVQQATNRNGSFDIYYRIRDSAGEVIEVREQGRGVYDDSGNLVALEGYITRRDTESARELY